MAHTVRCLPVGDLLKAFEGVGVCEPDGECGDLGIGLA
jgi:hypothetical protein